MHIPDGFLDSRISLGMIGVAVSVLGYSLAKVREAVTSLKPVFVLATVGQGIGNPIGSVRRGITGDGQRTIYKMGMVALLILAVQMYDFPVGGGTSGHLLGGALAAILLGPFAGTIVMSVVLALQTLFFSDGGLLALGANIVNLAVVGSLVAYYIYYFIKKGASQWVAIMIAAWASVVLASLACALELGFSGTIPFAVVIPAMVKVGLVVGVAEALFSWALLHIYNLAVKA